MWEVVSKIFGIFTPKIGKMIQFDEHLFQMGVVQPPTSRCGRVPRPCYHAIRHSFLGPQGNPAPVADTVGNEVADFLCAKPGAELNDVA